MEHVLEVNADNWDKEILESEELTVVDFWHEQCIWCKRLEPIYDEVAEEYKGQMKFTKLNVLKDSENQQVSVKYGVMGTPTLLFFCGRALEPVERAVGFQPKDRLKQLIEKVINQHKDCVKKSSKLKI